MRIALGSGGRTSSPNAPANLLCHHSHPLRVPLLLKFAVPLRRSALSPGGVPVTIADYARTMPSFDPPVACRIL
jgi:hypothetical protein